MKKLGFAAFVLVFAATQAVARPSLLPEITLKIKGETVKIVTSVQRGVSQNWLTVKVSHGPIKIAQLGYSSFGGMVVSKGPRYADELVIWDYYQAETEAHLDNHRYVVLVYRWLSHDKLEPAFYYKTQKRYSCWQAGKAPYQEFLANRSGAFDILNIKRKKLAAMDLMAIKRQMLRGNPAMNVITRAYVLGPWAIVSKITKSLPDMPETGIWEKTPKGWHCLGEGAEAWSEDRETPAKNGIPWFLWQKLTDRFWQ